GLEIPMNDAALVDRMGRFGQGAEQFGGRPRAQGLVLEACRETATFEILHYEERLTLMLVDVEDLHDVRVLHLSDDFRLALETPPAVRGIVLEPHRFQR